MESNKIIEYVEKIMESNKNNKLPKEKYIENLKIEHKDLYETYPGIFQMCCDNTMDINRLKKMLNMSDKINNNTITEHDASVKVGQMLVDDFVKPSITK